MKGEDNKMKKEIDAIIIEIKQEFSLVGERDWFFLLINENRRYN